jgi:hypothetical protein
VAGWQGSRVAGYAMPCRRHRPYLLIAPKGLDRSADSAGCDCCGGVYRRPPGVSTDPGWPPGGMDREGLLLTRIGCWSCLHRLTGAGTVGADHGSLQVVTGGIVEGSATCDEGEALLLSRARDLVQRDRR